MKAKWTVADIPDLSGKIAIVTGANVGLGLEIATQLAMKNSRVYLACRTPSKAESAKAEILKVYPSALIETPKLDISSLESVREFARDFLSCHDRLDILMCNAGVMAFSDRRESIDGYELQFATNHLGHFLLTGLLHPLLRSTSNSRVVTQSSSGNWSGSFAFDDLNATQTYNPWGQYSMTKLANVAFAYEYNKRLQKESVSAPKAFSVHPGLVIGQLQSVQAGNNVLYKMLYGVMGVFAGTYETGALPALYGCVAEEAEAGEFYGPDGWMNGVLRGNHPKTVKPNKLAEDDEQTERLWKISEELTGFKFNV